MLSKISRLVVIAGPGLLLASPAVAAPAASITAPAGASPTVAAAVAYINGLLASGATPLALSNALQTAAATAGVANPGAIVGLSPQAYASASQIGVENGLALAVTLRGRSFAPASATGAGQLFTFGEGLGDRRELPGSASLATARANIREGGAIGGVGFGSTAALVALFVGYLDAHQSIGSIGASTSDHGVVAGAIAQGRIADVDVTALLAWDGSVATTRRTLPNGSHASGRYHMRGLIADATADYGFEFQHGWWVHPRIGVTYISSKRRATSETGAGAFDLDVAGKRTEAGFVSGEIRFVAEPGAALQPWVSAGVRYQFKGSTSSATSSFTGTAATLTVPGVTRERTVAILAGGLSASVGSHIDLFTRIDGEFGSGTTSENGSAGILYRF